MLPKRATSPIPVDARNPFRDPEPDPDFVRERQNAWVEEIKERARQNLADGLEHMRIAWQNRFRVPRYPDFADYPLDEAILEAWEQFYYEHPDSLELKGIVKRKNPRTGYAYYSTGDKLLDRLEEAFGRGETPDLEKVFAHIQDGPDIFRKEVFVDGGGESFAPRRGASPVVQTEAKGETMGRESPKIQEDDFTSDRWVEDALRDDPVLKGLAERMGKLGG